MPEVVKSELGVDYLKFSAQEVREIVFNTCPKEKAQEIYDYIMNGKEDYTKARTWWEKNKFYALHYDMNKAFDDGGVRRYLEEYLFRVLALSNLQIKFHRQRGKED